MDPGRDALIATGGSLPLDGGEKPRNRTHAMNFTEFLIIFKILKENEIYNGLCASLHPNE